VDVFETGVVNIHSSSVSLIPAGYRHMRVLSGTLLIMLFSHSYNHKLRLSLCDPSKSKQNPLFAAERCADNQDPENPVNQLSSSR